MIGVNTNYVLDTNSLIMSLSSRNKYSYIWDAFVTGRYSLCVTNGYYLNMKKLFQETSLGE